MMIRLVHVREGHLTDINLHSMPVKGDFIQLRPDDAHRDGREVEITNVTHVEDGYLGHWARVMVQDA